jgi:hypothetical protein
VFIVEAGHKKRSYLRFLPDPNTFAWVCECDDASTFEPQIAGLVVNESHTGCGAVFLKSQTYDQLKIDGKYYIGVGALSPTKCELKWIKDLDEDTVRMGFEYVK